MYYRFAQTIHGEGKQVTLSIAKGRGSPPLPFAMLVYSEKYPTLAA
jgi:hypothetical protein